MLATRGIAMADHLDTIFSKENRVLPTIARHFRALCREKLWRWLGTTGSKKNKDQQDTHAQRLAPIR